MYRDVHFVKLDLMHLEEVQEVVISVIDGIARVIIGLLSQQEQIEEDEVEIDATFYIKTQTKKKIKKVEKLISTATPRAKEFYRRKIQILREFQQFFQIFLKERAIFRSSDTQAEIMGWRKGVFSQLCKTVCYDNSQEGYWEKWIPSDVFVDNREQRIKMHHSFKGLLRKGIFRSQALFSPRENFAVSRLL